MKKLLIPALAILVFAACRPENGALQQAGAPEPPLTVSTQEHPEWQYENLRLYPILATENFISENEASRQLKTLGEAMEIYGFRISEKKPYGRFEDEGAVNNLTVQNKTEEQVFLMAGDIVQGGLQDRVVGEDQIVAARSLQDIPVFCVERGRWQYQGAGNEPGPNDRVFAFSGYYHVAAGDIRYTLANSKDQHEVWDGVSRLTDHHGAESRTGAYAALEGAEEFTRTRDAYLRYYSDKFAAPGNMVGLIAVSGNKLIGADVFGHPDLFRRQLNALLHSYATDAVTKGGPVSIRPEAVERQLESINRSIAGPKAKHYQGALVHYYHAAEAEN